MNIDGSELVLTDFICCEALFLSFCLFLTFQVLAGPTGLRIGTLLVSIKNYLCNIHICAGNVWL